MKKILLSILALALIFITIIIVYFSPRPLIANNSDISKITIFDQKTESVVITIDDPEKIKTIISQLNQIIVKPVAFKLSDAKDSYIVIFYDKFGNTYDTFFTSDDKIYKHHWIQKVLKGQYNNSIYY